MITARIRQNKKNKKTLDKVRLLNKETINVKRTEIEIKKTANIVYKVVIK